MNQNVKETDRFYLQYRHFTMSSIFSVNEMTCLHLVFVLFVVFACSVIYPSMYFLQVYSSSHSFFFISGMFLFVQYLKKYSHRLRNTQQITLGGSVFSCRSVSFQKRENISLCNLALNCSISLQPENTGFLCMCERVYSCEAHGKILKQVEANMWVLRVIPIYFPAAPISATLSFSS